VSTTQSLLRALHICLRSIHGDTESYIAVIDTATLHSIDAVQNNDAGPNARKAFGEFVCWATIPGDAILCVFPIQKLLDFTLSQQIDQLFNIRTIGTFRSTKFARRAVSAGKQPLNYHFGRAVGSLLSFLAIPMATIEYMTTSILTDFFLQKDEAWKQNLEFLRGRNEALGINPLSAEDDQFGMDRFISDLCRYAGAHANPLSSTAVSTTGQLNSIQRFVRVEIAKSAENT
ncbi:MAG: hypothetical protein Q9214_007592, partial [Letrouitia sp. 1 TL-2023]